MRVNLAAAVAAASAVALAVAGCGSHTDTSSASPPSTSTSATAASACPTAAPSAPGAVEWSFKGATGNVEVTGSTDSAAPVVKVDSPFTVSETQVHTLKEGDGPVVAPTARVNVCYMGVDGRDGHVFDSAYQRGEPVEFPLEGVVPGFQKAIAGQKVGSIALVHENTEYGNSVASVIAEQFAKDALPVTQTTQSAQWRCRLIPHYPPHSCNTAAVTRTTLLHWQARSPPLQVAVPKARAVYGRPMTATLMS
jgi:peptidylprolyl isomerase